MCILVSENKVGRLGYQGRWQREVGQFVEFADFIELSTECRWGQSLQWTPVGLFVCISDVITLADGRG